MEGEVILGGVSYGYGNFKIGNKMENEFGASGKDDHVFGISDVLSGNEYDPGTTVKVLVVGWNGRRDYKTKDNKIKRAGHYKVFEDGVTKEFRLSISNEVWLAKKGGIKSYEDLVGRELWLKVVFYNLGNGFVITAVGTQKTSAEPAPKPKVGPSGGTVAYASKAQQDFIDRLMAAQGATAIVSDYLTQRGISGRGALTKRQAAEIIDQLKTLDGNKEEGGGVTAPR